MKRWLSDIIVIFIVNCREIVENMGICYTQQVLNPNHEIHTKDCFISESIVIKSSSQQTVKCMKRKLWDHPNTSGKWLNKIDGIGLVASSSLYTILTSFTSLCSPPLIVFPT